MVALVLTAVAIFLLLCISEFLWRKTSIDTEYTRKFVHISVGTFVAFWPFFLSRWEIVLMSGAFLAVVLLSTKIKLFKAVHSVQRPTVGESCFALSVGILALVAQSDWIYFAALMHMSLADGLAAVLGTKFGKRGRYYIFGHAKSIFGTTVFLLVSLGVLIAYSLLANVPFNVLLVPVAIIATVIENWAVMGLDNLFVPLFIALALSVLR